MTDTPTCDRTGCDYTAKYKHTWMQGEIEIERHWCGYHTGDSTHELEQIKE